MKKAIITLALLLFFTPATIQASEHTPWVFSVCPIGDADFRELNEIDWDRIVAGDAVELCRAIFHTEMKVGTGGVLILGNGAIIDGGRTRLLPECGQRGWVKESPLLTQGIFLNQPNVTIDSIEIRNTGRIGIRMGPNASGSTIRNVEIHNNGSVDVARWNGGTQPGGFGIWIAGQNITIEDSEIFDNGEDGIQSRFGNNNLGNVRILNNKIYNTRKNSEGGNWNDCAHADGIHIYDGGDISGVEIRGNTIENVTNGIIMGQSGRANVSNVLIQGNKIIGCHDNGIWSYAQTVNTNWKVINNNVSCPTLSGALLGLQGSDNQVIRNEFEGNPERADDYINTSNAVVSGNCQIDIDFEVFEVCEKEQVGNLDLYRWLEFLFRELRN